VLCTTTTPSLSRRLGRLIHRSLLAITIASLLVASPGFAEVLVSDDFPTNGTLTGTTPAVGGAWARTSGTANQIQVVNNRVQLTDSAVAIQPKKASTQNLLLEKTEALSKTFLLCTKGNTPCPQTRWPVRT